MQRITNLIDWSSLSTQNEFRWCSNECKLKLRARMYSERAGALISRIIAVRGSWRSLFYVLRKYFIKKKKQIELRKLNVEECLRKSWLRSGYHWIAVRKRHTHTHTLSTEYDAAGDFAACTFSTARIHAI